MIVSISDPNDPQIAAYRDIRERDLVGRQGLFIAEGEVVLRCLSRSTTCEPLSVLIDAKRLGKLQPILKSLGDIPVFVADQQVVDAIAGFHLHRGILALGRHRCEPSLSEIIKNAPGRAVVLGLFGIANHDNMGGLFRNAAAFGAQAVLVDEACCDPLYRKSIRVSVGAVLTVPFLRITDNAASLTALQAAGFEIIALSPAGHDHLADIQPSPRTAVLLGAEGPGLPPAILDLARSVSIPMAAQFDSLNVATTAGIVLHHLNFPPPS